MFFAGLFFVPTLRPQNTLTLTLSRSTGEGTRRLRYDNIFPSPARREKVAEGRMRAIKKGVFYTPLR